MNYNSNIKERLHLHLHLLDLLMESILSKEKILMCIGIFSFPNWDNHGRQVGKLEELRQTVHTLTTLIRRLFKCSKAESRM